MIIEREVSTNIMLILIVTFDWGNQYRMGRNSQKRFKYIQFIGPATVTDIQTTARVIDK